VWTFAEWCQQSAIGEAVRHSLWAFPLVESVHLLGLALVGGAVLLVNLRLLGWILAGVPLADLARDAERALIGGLVIMLASGFVLFSSEAEKMYGNSAFRTKMLCLAAALLFTFTIHWRVVHSDEQRVSGVTRRLAAAISLLLWSGVGISGRAIGFF
jgi:hypothetical protein